MSRSWIGCGDHHHDLTQLELVHVGGPNDESYVATLNGDHTSAVSPSPPRRRCVAIAVAFRHQRHTSVSRCSTRNAHIRRFLEYWGDQCKKLLCKAFIQRADVVHGTPIFSSTGAASLLFLPGSVFGAGSKIMVEDWISARMWTKVGSEEIVGRSEGRRRLTGTS